MADDKKKPAAGGPEQQEDRPVIRIDTPEYDPTLDPESPEFDAEKWAELMERKKEIGKQLKESLDKTIAEMETPIFKAFSSGEIPTAIKDAMADAVKPVSQGFEVPGVSAAALERIKAAANEMRDTLNQIVAPSFKAAQAYFKSDEWKTIRDAVAEIAEIAPLWLKLGDEIEELTPYIEAELQKPEYEGKTISELFNTAETDEDGNPIEGSLLLKALHAARAARDADIALLKAQQAGRDQRRQIKENAISSGAIMGLQTKNLVTFSERDLWNAFAPGRISKIGTLAKDEIDDTTGQVIKNELERGEIVPVSAIEVSYKALFLLNTILANSVENYRERFIKDGAITFYVKGVLDDLEIDPRIRNDGQLDLNRKTAGVIYLEKQFAPLLQFIGTIPDGSRYSVFSYDGYDVNTDTMTVRIPYLFQLWKRTQIAFAQRRAAKQKRIEEGKKPLKKDLKPLEVNALFKPVAYKEDDAVLEIATYITNVLLSAGTGAHKTEITFNTLIKN